MATIGVKGLRYILIFPLFPAAPGDYTSVTRQLSFNSAVTAFNVFVPIINDNLIEQVESFLANLRLVSAVGSVSIAPPQATVSIQSDDRELLHFIPYTQCF